MTFVIMIVWILNLIGFVSAWTTENDEMWTETRLHHKKEQTPKKKNRIKKKTGYKINLDFDVIYTKHMLIVHLKIIYLFSQQNRILYRIHWRLNSAEFWNWKCGRLQRLKNRQAAASCSSFSGGIFRPIYNL